MQRLLATVLTGFGLGVTALGASAGALAEDAKSGVSMAAAASYMDAQALAWAHGDDRAVAASDRCALSCHTTYPFMTVRSGMGDADRAAVAEIRRDVEARVRNWAAGKPWYPSIAARARGSEAVLNAASLAQDDARMQRTTAAPTTLEALANMWAMQRADGGWDWMGNFGLFPWESSESEVWGAAQAVLAIAKAPGDYKDRCLHASSEFAGCQRLKSYLLAAFRDRQAPLVLLNKAAVLMASSALEGLLTPAEAQMVVREIRASQGPGGAWSLAALRDDTTATKVDSAYATAFLLSTLADAGVTAQDPTARRGLAWLKRHQSDDGSWRDQSLNQPDSDFNNKLMTDAATSHAVIALMKYAEPTSQQNDVQ